VLRLRLKWYGFMLKHIKNIKYLKKRHNLGYNRISVNNNNNAQFYTLRKSFYFKESGQVMGNVN